uniref:Uncharacterized protein n=1 Tax=Trypanosoma congolense (strain IL3000) TaxID=1068625 RepID=G0USS6_TRYCI|nr:conserved hypothetical protein [Trypanosoma congolense IL3000]
MLTALSWVPKAGMRPVPIHTGDDVEAVRSKLRRQNPDRSTVDREAVDEPDGGDASSEDVDDMDIMRFGGGTEAILEQVESEDEDEINDITFKDTDLVFTTAVADAAQPRLELYVYDEPENNIYVHHDMEIAAFPLTTAWLTDGTVSLCAVGTMLPFIELWNLDVMDSVEPASLLGGCMKWEDNYRRKLKTQLLQPDSHKDAVISVRWNTCAQHILASGSADCTIKLWDLNTSSCLGTYAESDKVQSLDWHREEANLLLSGGFDSTMTLRDCRSPESAALRFAVGSTIEHVEFAPQAGGRILYASSNTGAWVAFEARMNAEVLWSVQVHESDTTFAASPHVPGLLAAGGKDGMISLWDARDTTQPPKEIVRRSYRTGSVMSLAFHPNSPHVLGACGSKGEPLVYIISNDVQGIFQ